MSIRKRTKLIIGAIAIVALFCFNVNLEKDSGNVANISLSGLNTSSAMDGEVMCYRSVVGEGGVPGHLCWMPNCGTCSSCGGLTSYCP